MQKQDLKIGQNVYHRNLKQKGYISSLETGDNTSCFVEFESGDELEVSVHLLENREIEK